jgi:hypothetical protein
MWPVDGEKKVRLGEGGGRRLGREKEDGWGRWVGETTENKLSLWTNERACY